MIYCISLKPIFETQKETYQTFQVHSQKTMNVHASPFVFFRFPAEKVSEKHRLKSSGPRPGWEKEMFSRFPGRVEYHIT